MDIVPGVVTILKDLDRMLKNPDIALLENLVQKQLEEEGLLRLFVFVCPKFNTAALFSNSPEKYIPITTSKDDLLQPRIPKIKELRENLKRLGVLAEINFVIGDNDAEQYLFPFLGIEVDTKKLRKRQLLYKKATEERAGEIFGKNVIVWSLAEEEVIADKSAKLGISGDQLSKERVFFQWLFSNEGPYKGKLSFDDETINKIILVKFLLYGSQGKFLEDLGGGILLQTEGPRVWLLRTQMLRCTGFATTALAVIYPWIRKEELKGEK